MDEINPQIDRIKKFLKENPYFSKIKDIDIFAEKIVIAYSTKDIISDLKKMDLWLIANPLRLKKNYKSFIVRWLNRSYGQKN